MLITKTAVNTKLIVKNVTAQKIPPFGIEIGADENYLCFQYLTLSTLILSLCPMVFIVIFRKTKSKSNPLAWIA